MFVMYCVNGTSRSSLLIESTDSMIYMYIYVCTSVVDIGNWMYVCVCECVSVCVRVC